MTQIENVDMAVKLLKTIIETADNNPEFTVSCAIIINEVSKVIHEKHACRTGSFGIGDVNIYFRLANAPDAMDKMHTMMNETALSKQQDETEATN